MAKVSLTKSELAMLDALIADMQSESESESAPQEVDVPAQAMFIGAIGGAVFKVVAKATGVAAKATPVAVKATPMIMQAIGHAKSAEAGSDPEAMSQSLGDGEALSVDKLIELRKAFN